MLCDFSNLIKKNKKILNSKMMCDKLLKETGFAMLPGSDFGMNDKLFISRIAFVDFDGKKALQYVKDNKTLSHNSVKIICPKIVRGIKKLKKWIQENF